ISKGINPCASPSRRNASASSWNPSSPSTMAQLCGIGRLDSPALTGSSVASAVVQRRPSEVRGSRPRGTLGGASEGVAMDRIQLHPRAVEAIARSVDLRKSAVIVCERSRQLLTTCQLEEDQFTLSTRTHQARAEHSESEISRLLAEIQRLDEIHAAEVANLRR